MRTAFDLELVRAPDRVSRVLAPTEPRPSKLRLVDPSWIAKQSVSATFVSVMLHQHRNLPNHAPILAFARRDNVVPNTGLR